MGCTDARIPFGILAGRRALMNLNLIDEAKLHLFFGLCKFSSVNFFLRGESMGIIEYICSTKDSYMKKEIGKWLLDIAKYITTAVVLSSIFNGIEQQWVVMASGIGAVILTFTGGALLLREKKK